MNILLCAISTVCSVSISPTGIQYMDSVEIFNVSLDLPTIHFAHLVSVELPLCIVVTLSKNAKSCFLESS